MIKLWKTKSSILWASAFSACFGRFFYLVRSAVYFFSTKNALQGRTRNLEGLVNGHSI